MNFISIGGWCGTKLALVANGLFDEPSLPFDSVRSSLEGVIDCIQHDFKHFFPLELSPCAINKYKRCFIGEHVGFFHHDLSNAPVIERFKRQFERFDAKIKKDHCVFLRTVVRDHPDGELALYKQLQQVLDQKYPGLSYIICFILPNQPRTQYWKHLDHRTFLFTVNDRSHKIFRLKGEYRPIFDFIMNNQLFERIPPANDLKLAELSSRLWLMGGKPVVGSKINIPPKCIDGHAEPPPHQRAHGHLAPHPEQDGLHRVQRERGLHARDEGNVGPQPPAGAPLDRGVAQVRQKLQRVLEFEGGAHERQHGHDPHDLPRLWAHDLREGDGRLHRQHHGQARVQAGLFGQGKGGRYRRTPRTGQRPLF